MPTEGLGLGLGLAFAVSHQPQLGLSETHLIVRAATLSYTDDHCCVLCRLVTKVGTPRTTPPTLTLRQQQQHPTVSIESSATSKSTAVLARGSPTERNPRQQTPLRPLGGQSKAGSSRAHTPSLLRTPRGQTP